MPSKDCASVLLSEVRCLPLGVSNSFSSTVDKPTKNPDSSAVFSSYPGSVELVPQRRHIWLRCRGLIYQKPGLELGSLEIHPRSVEVALQGLCVPCAVRGPRRVFLLTQVRSSSEHTNSDKPSLIWRSRSLSRKNLHRRTLSESVRSIRCRYQPPWRRQWVYGRWLGFRPRTHWHQAPQKRLVCD